MKTMVVSRWILPFFAGVGIACGTVVPPIQMDVEEGETRCLEILVEAPEKGILKFGAVTEGTEVNVKVKVTEPSGKIRSMNCPASPSDYLAPKSIGDGTYEVCFHNLQAKEAGPTRVQVENTPAAKLEEQSAQSAKSLIERAQALADSLLMQMEVVKMFDERRGEDDKQLRYLINNLSFLTIVVVIFVSGWQLNLLNRFFRSKKLI